MVFDFVFWWVMCAYFSCVLSFSVCIPFISSCPIVPPKTGGTVLNRIEETAHPCLVPGFSGNAGIFSLV